MSRSVYRWRRLLQRMCSIGGKMGWLKGSGPKATIRTLKQSNEMLEKLRTLPGAYNEDEIQLLGECLGYLKCVEKMRKSFELVKMARDELGIPQPGYPAPVSNSVRLLKKALAQWEKEK